MKWIGAVCAALVLLGGLAACSSSTLSSGSTPVPCQIDQGTFQLYVVHPSGPPELVGYVWSGGGAFSNHTEVWALQGNYAGNQPHYGGPPVKLEFRSHTTNYPTEASFRNAFKMSTAYYMLHTARRIP